MSLLTTQEIKVRLAKQKYLVSLTQLTHRIEETQKITYNLFNILQKIDDNILVQPSNLLWQIGHFCFFYLHLIFPHLIDNWLDITQEQFLKEHNLTNLKYKKLEEFYNSFLTPPYLRNNNKNLIKLDEVIKIYKHIWKIINQYLQDHNTNYFNCYLIMLGILHQHMHLEAIIFHLQSHRIKLDFLPFQPSKILTLITSKNPINLELSDKIEWVRYTGGKTIQGSINSTTHLTFDNEKPCFDTEIKEFQVSKYLITEYQYTLFIEAHGYQKREYWCDVSWNWKEKENISLPLYWEWRDDTLEKDNLEDNKAKHKKLQVWRNGKFFSTLTKLPICHISYYEAQAYCRWKKVRLPLEKEYEYMATNQGINKYPWGNQNKIGDFCSVNYHKNIIEVDEMSQGNNQKGVSQLMGNVWEWCQEPIYPYDNFTIDPVYREMSYPFFGEKIICKGGSWCVPDFLIHPKYRNAQLPTCRIQYIGFRVCL